MGILDAFNAEDRVGVKFSDFYEMVKGCAERQVITNGLKYRIPHTHILAMLDELPETSERSTDARRDKAEDDRWPKTIVTFGEEGANDGND